MSEGLRSGRVLNRLAALFIGLPASDARAALKDLRFSNQQIAWIGHLVEAWELLGARMERALMASGPLAAAEVRAWAAGAGRTQARSLFRIACAVWAGKREAGEATVPATRVVPAYRALVRSAYRDPIALGDLAVDGEDLLAAGFARGPTLGKILRALLARVVDDPSLNTRETLLRMAREIAGEEE